MGCLLWHVESPRGRTGPGPLLALGLISRGSIRLQLRCGAPGLAGGGQGGPGSRPCSGRAPARGVKVPTAPTAAGGTRGAAVSTQHIARRVLHQYGAAGRMTTVGGSGVGVHTGPALSSPRQVAVSSRGVRAAGPPLPGGVPLGLLCREPGLEIFHRSRARASSRHCGGLGSAAGLEKIKRPFCRFLRGTKFVMGTCQCHVRGGHLQHGVRACGRLCPLLKMKKRWKEHCPALRLVRPRGDAAGPPLATPGSTPAPRSLYR